MAITALLEAQAVVSADAGRRCHLFPAQAGRAAHAGDVQAHLPRIDLLTARPQELAERIRGGHPFRISAAEKNSLVLPSPGCAGYCLPRTGPGRVRASHVTVISRRTHD